LETADLIRASIFYTHTEAHVNIDQVHFCEVTSPCAAFSLRV